MNEQIKGVKVWEEDIIIPTYEVGEPDKNPMFLEKRVYQGSSGKVYPNPVIDKIYDEKIEKKYHAVMLENEYLQIMILPEIGGRVQRALDKTNNYDFVYYNEVIKPALVGLAGPWISGGIEFNWPQHHRPSTFDKVDYTIQENEDGSKTIWVSEIEKMFRTKGMAGFTLYPGKAYFEIKVQLYNRTPDPQTFLWWANPAVAVNDHTQSVFPPDVFAVFDHGKRDVSKFPIATGTYYKMDYSSGVDISRYKNIPVPTSYMAYRSDFNFVGGYDHGKEAGILHVADHHVSPGKKQWTWGCGDFGQAWDRNLTDENGPYIELMTGVFTDNQPDFSWINSYEEKEWKQYFMPYKGIGYAKNATIDAAVNLEVTNQKAYIAAYTTSSQKGTVIELRGKNKKYLNIIQDLSPEMHYACELTLDESEKESDLLLTVKDNQGRLLVSYRPLEKKIEEVPEAAKPALQPEEIMTNEDLYLTGLHIEQYRHATYEPDWYYLEGLKRDPSDIRINNAYGKLLYRRGLFAESEGYFRAAIATMTKRNPNPYDGEPYYNLGLALKMQGKEQEAYGAFYKAIWNAAFKDSGYYELACIASRWGDYNTALEHVENSIIRNYHNYKARNIKSAILRRLGRLSQAEKLVNETIELDILDFGSRYELYLIELEKGQSAKSASLLAQLKGLMRKNSHSYIEISLDYASAGLYKEAIELLEIYFREVETESQAIPMAYYYMSSYMNATSNKEMAAKHLDEALKANTDYCFPNRLEDIVVLKAAIEANPKDFKVLYYLGNLWYDRKQSQKAIDCWEQSRSIDDTFPTVHRNLALAYYNKCSQPQKAKEALEKAFSLNRSDARVFLELDQLYKKLGVLPEERLKYFEENRQIVDIRDDLYLEYAGLFNLLGNYEKALELIMNRKFHPWEGGEGKVTSQYVFAHVEIAKQQISKAKYEEAIQHLNAALVYPHNLGEGKLAGATENNINYFLGCAYEGLGDIEKAKEYFKKASVGLDEPTNAMFYNDQPPEMIFYQGMALLKLSEQKCAWSKFNKLIDYGEKHIFDNVTIDYFAVSLPDFLIFEEDLNRKNAIHCHYLMGLGLYGKGECGLAKQELEKALKLDVNHYGVSSHLKMLKQS